MVSISHSSRSLFSYFLSKIYVQPQHASLHLDENTKHGGDGPKPVAVKGAHNYMFSVIYFTILNDINILVVSLLAKI